ncbi:hypothetical protein GW17_00005266 [Ensete ventricosum]|nr:hypothetical protein GW17_00005266 [Ensete ventricosum]
MRQGSPYRAVRPRTARYIPVRQLTGTRISRYRGYRRRGKEEIRSTSSSSSPECCPRALAARGRLLSPRGKTKRLPTLGERPRRLQVPLYVATRMASIRRSSFFVPSPDTYARAALRHIGYEPRCTPYWPHSLIWCLLSSIPESVIDHWRLGFCMNIRKRGQLKDAKKKDS